jgi:hypothetical protein
MRLENYLNELALKVPDDMDTHWNAKNTFVDIKTNNTKIHVSFAKSRASNIGKAKLQTRNRYKIDFGVSERGDAKTLDVFMAVLQVIRVGIKKLNITSFWLLPADLKRSNLYKRLLNKFLPSGWSVEDGEHPFEKDAKTFLVTKN